MGTDEPIFRDEHFRQKRKHDVWEIVTAPHSFAPIADTHAHLDMLPDPGLSLARAGVHEVAFVETIVNPVEDDATTFARWDEWMRAGELSVRQMGSLCCGQAPYRLPKVRIGYGVHPHNAKDYTDELEASMEARVRADARISAIGEIGLDYHYDLSERDAQREVFARQVELAKRMGLPVLLHMREAHDDGFAILEEVGFPEAGTLLHCYTLDEREIVRWIEAGCYIAFGGALTFKKSDEVRQAAKLVPLDRLLTETDAPYMTPEPMRGTRCGTEHVVFTAERLAQVRGFDADSPQRRAFYQQLYDNAVRLLDRPRDAAKEGE